MLILRTVTYIIFQNKSLIMYSLYYAAIICLFSLLCLTNLTKQIKWKTLESWYVLPTLLFYYIFNRYFYCRIILTAARTRFLSAVKNNGNTSCAAWCHRVCPPGSPVCCSGCCCSCCREDGVKSQKQRSVGQSLRQRACGRRQFSTRTGRRVDFCWGLLFEKWADNEAAEAELGEPQR